MQLIPPPQELLSVRFLMIKIDDVFVDCQLGYPQSVLSSESPGRSWVVGLSLPGGNSLAMAIISMIGAGDLEGSDVHDVKG